jgi:predicted PurR-regulated permease PerM
VGAQLKSLAGSLATGLGSAIAGVTTFVLVVIFYLFLAVERDRILGVCQPFLPETLMNRICERAPRIRKLLLTWWKGQILMSGAMALTTLVVLIFLRIIGIEVTHIFSLALIAGLCVFIPVIGPIIAAIPAVLSVSSGGFIDISIVIFAYFCIQQIEGFLLIPKIHGNSLQLSDFEVIFWMTLSGSLF